jgi:hypothetical protein
MSSCDGCRRLSFVDQNDVTYVKSTEVYDPTTDTWTDVASPLPGPDPPNKVFGNLFMAGGAAGGKLYVVVRSSGWFAQVYDPGTNAWTSETPTSLNDGQLDMVTIGNTIYVVGSGYMSPGIKLWAWQPDTDLWRIRTGLSAQWRAAHIAVNGKLYAIGGVSGTVATQLVTAAVQEYDPAADAWTPRGSLNVARESAAAAILDGMVYVFGGSTAGGVPSAAVEAKQFVTTCGGEPACERAVFVKSGLLSTNLGGLEGADAKCTAAAAVALSPRIKGRDFVAWLSNETTSAKDRLVHGVAPYVRADGVQIAANWDALVSGSLEAPISVNENAVPITLGTSVWTATDVSGTMLTRDDAEGILLTACRNWRGAAASSDLVALGNATARDRRWSYGGGTGCDPSSVAATLYCIER